MIAELCRLLTLYDNNKVKNIWINTLKIYVDEAKLLKSKEKILI